MKITITLTNNEINKVGTAMTDSSIITCDQLSHFMKEAGHDYKVTSDGATGTWTCNDESKTMELNINDTLVCQLIDMVSPCIVMVKSIYMTLTNALKAFTTATKKNLAYFKDGVSVQKIGKNGNAKTSKTQDVTTAI